MERLDVALPPPRSTLRYPIFIGSSLLAEISSLLDLSGYSRIAVAADANVARHWAGTLLGALPQARLIEIPAGENNKNLAQVEDLWRRCGQLKLDRKSLLINLGGGMVGDLGGFAASTFMRGLDFIQIPTSLLAQVDASVGGKVGVNLDHKKNLVGVFNQPQAVIVDVATLATLPQRELWSGFAEIVKHGLIQQRRYFLGLTGLTPDQLNERQLVELIKGSCQIKAAVVQADERESGPRKLLNFGHTIGHAVETLALDSSTPLLHGEAVSLGLVAESWLSYKTGGLSWAELKSIEAELARWHLPTRSAAPPDTSRLLELIAGDKKNVGGKTKWTLLTGIGQAIFDQEVPPQLVIEAVEYLGSPA